MQNKEVLISREELITLRRERPGTWPLMRKGISLDQWIEVYEACEAGADRQAVADRLNVPKSSINSGMVTWRNYHGKNR